MQILLRTKCIGTVKYIHGDLIHADSLKNYVSVLELLKS